MRPQARKDCSSLPVRDRATPELLAGYPDRA